MITARCLYCECIQTAAAKCRRCGRDLPATALVKTESNNTRIVERPLVDTSLTIEEIIRVVILARLKLYAGDVERTAHSLQISRSGLYHKLSQYRLETKSNFQTPTSAKGLAEKHDIVAPSNRTS